jgi:hypothetical protein
VKDFLSKRNNFLDQQSHSSRNEASILLPVLVLYLCTNWHVSIVPSAFWRIVENMLMESQLFFDRLRECEAQGPSIPRSSEIEGGLQRSSTPNFAFQAYVQGLNHIQTHPPIASPPPSAVSILQLINQSEEEPKILPNMSPLGSPPNSKGVKKRFVCLWLGCGTSFSTRTGLATHCHSHLSSGSSMKIFACRWGQCTEIFPDNKMLAKHLASESHIGQTPFVPKNRSKTVSSSESRYICSFEGCGKSFTNASNRKVI